MNEEQCHKLIAEIINGNDRDDFADPSQPSGNYTYAHLMVLLMMRGKIDGVDELFRSLYEYSIACGKASIVKKATSGEKIRVFFLSYSAAEFPAEGVYDLLKSDDRFEVKVMLVPLTDRSREDALDTYKKSRKSFSAKGYDFFDTWNTKTNALLSWVQMGGYPDIMIHTSSWNQCIADPYQITHCPLTTLNAYIPYAVTMVNSTDGSFIGAAYYGNPIITLMWKYFVSFDYEKSEFKRHNTLQGNNVQITGYPKMDVFIKPGTYSDEEIRKLWSIPKGSDLSQHKRVIISPHYSVLYAQGVSLSTFHENMYFYLYLAKKYKDSVTFVFKPHPNLRRQAVMMRLFDSFEHYDAYLKLWQDLPNGKVSDEDDYLSLFATSDGIINDSGSFLMEYQFTKKPMLYLRKSSQTFRDITKELLNCLYKVPGSDLAGIENFLNDVIINENDHLKNKRSFFGSI